MPVKKTIIKPNLLNPYVKNVVKPGASKPAAKVAAKPAGGKGNGWGNSGGKGGGGKGEMVQALLAQLSPRELANLPQLLGGGKTNTFKVDKSGGELGEFTGTIKSFNDSKAYGFIESEELTNQGYGDAFLHADMKKGYRQGMVVKFTCVLTKEGKPNAINLKSGIGGKSATAASSSGGAKGSDSSGEELGQFTGTIKSFSDKSGYGFIESEEVTSQGHGDVFLHYEQKKGYKKGQTVKFTCVLNKDGKPQAINLKSGLK